MAPYRAVRALAALRVSGVLILFAACGLAACGSSGGTVGLAQATTTTTAAVEGSTTSESPSTTEAPSRVTVGTSDVTVLPLPRPSTTSKLTTPSTVARTTTSTASAGTTATTAAVTTTTSTAGAGMVSGAVTSSPSCPVERADQPCPPKPVQANVSARNGAGTTVATAPSDATGHYRLSLAPGSYTLVVDTGSVYPRCPETAVTVPPGGSVTADISCDSGIR